MKRRELSDAVRIASLREVIRAANGDWHDATALWSVQADVQWLLDSAEPERADLADTLCYLREHSHLAKRRSCAPARKEAAAITTCLRLLHKQRASA